MELEGDRSDVGMKVEECGGAAAEPLGDVLGVGQRRAERHDADVLLDLGRHEAHPRADHLQHRLKHNHHATR